MATIQSGRFINKWSVVCRLVGIIAIGVIALVLFRLPKRKFIPLCFVAALIYFSVTVMIFRSTLSWTSPFSAFALFGLMFLIGLLVSGDKNSPVAPAED
jgi:drug/metabolite transporter (DMT)-like permease